MTTAVALAQVPRLLAESLREMGVSIFPPAVGVPLAGPTPDGQKRHHVDFDWKNGPTLSDIGALATLIGHVGKTVRFHALWLPPLEKGVLDAILVESRNVSVRLLRCYAPGVTDAIGRIDVLFGTE
jgi:hypothetical protein